MRISYFMQLKNLAFIFAIGVITLLASCAKEGPTGPTGPAGPSYVGTISGHVSLYDQYGSKVLTNLDSVSLLLTGAAAAVHPDNTGYYVYYPIATGEYNIVASATGYGATNTNNFQFLSGTLNKDIKLSAIPTFSLTSTASQGASGGYDTVIVNSAADPQVRSFVLFVGYSAAVSNATSTFLLSYSKNIPANATKVTTVISAQELYNAGFAPGNMAYFAIYSEAAADQSVYEDQTTGKNVYTAVSNPVIDSAIVP